MKREIRRLLDNYFVHLFIPAMLIEFWDRTEQSTLYL